LRFRWRRPAIDPAGRARRPHVSPYGYVRRQHEMLNASASRPRWTRS
jgi:hypothetical protein